MCACVHELPPNLVSPGERALWRGQHRRRPGRYAGPPCDRGGLESFPITIFCPRTAPSGPRPFSGRLPPRPLLHQRGTLMKQLEALGGPSLLPAAAPAFEVWDSKLIPVARAGDDRLAVPSSTHFLLPFGLTPCLGPSLLPVTPLWRSLGSGALRPLAATGRWTPCPSLQDSSGGEHRATARLLWLSVRVWQEAWVGQEASRRRQWLQDTAQDISSTPGSVTITTEGNPRARAQPPPQAGRSWGTLGTGVEYPLGFCKARPPSFQMKHAASSLEGFRATRPCLAPSYVPNPLPGSHWPWEPHTKGRGWALCLLLPWQVSASVQLS